MNVVCEDEGLSSTECDCRGYLSKVHHSCLKEWVRYKGSTRCEICTSHFACVTPPLQPGLLQLEVCIYDVSYSVPYNVLKLLLLMISIYIPGAKQIDHIHIMRGVRGQKNWPPPTPSRSGKIIPRTPPLISVINHWIRNAYHTINLYKHF